MIVDINNNQIKPEKRLLAQVLLKTPWTDKIISEYLNSVA